MTMAESAALFIREFDLQGTPEAVADEMNAMMDEHYRKDIPLKAGVRDYLHRLSEDGVRMCVASATAQPLMEACLRRLGYGSSLNFCSPVRALGPGKNRPDVYHAAAEKLGAPAQEIAVYEDALYALKTAKDAGYYVVGVYDECTKNHWNEIMQLADEYICSWE